MAQEEEDEEPSGSGNNPSGNDVHMLYNAIPNGRRR